jgi:hypothetical protein
MSTKPPLARMPTEEKPTMLHCVTWIPAEWVILSPPKASPLASIVSAKKLM